MVGPAASTKEAQRLLKSRNIAGAILDVNLIDGHVGPVALELLKRGVPFVVQTGLALPSELAHLNELVAVFAKPVAPQVILGHLAKKLPIRPLLTL